MTKKNTEKEFGLSSWAITNKTTMYMAIALILLLGATAYFSMPRENFPEIHETKIYISSMFPGNTAEDIEKLITDPLEDKLKNVSGVVEITSTSQEDYSMVIVEFEDDMSVDSAKQKVKDEIDRETSNEDWPTFNGAKVEPSIFELSLSEEMPILNINISGDYPVQKLKEFAEYLEDEIEDLEEIKQVDIRGAQEKEVEVAVDIYKMMAAKVNFDDITGAIQRGNTTMSAGAGRSRKLLTMATDSARSAAGSSTRAPPTTLTNTSWSSTGICALRSMTASKMARRPKEDRSRLMLRWLPTATAIRPSANSVSGPRSRNASCVSRPTRDGPSTAPSTI